MVPLCPLTESVVVPPLQTGVGDALAVPPTEAELIPIATTDELAAEQEPLVTTARYCIAAVIAVVG